jgi:hypothetical protein
MTTTTAPAKPATEYLLQDLDTRFAYSFLGTATAIGPDGDRITTGVVVVETENLHDVDAHAFEVPLEELAEFSAIPHGQPGVVRATGMVVSYLPDGDRRKPWAEFAGYGTRHAVVDVTACRITTEHINPARPVVLSASTIEDPGPEPEYSDGTW